LIDYENIIFFTCKKAEELNQKDNAPSSLVFVVVLIAICFISINNYFCYHEPSAIALQFDDFYSLSTEDFGTLFTIYSELFLFFPVLAPLMRVSFYVCVVYLVHFTAEGVSQTDATQEFVFAKQNLYVESPN
jgi:hypothetical protein